MTRDEAMAILDLPREEAICAIIALAEKSEKHDRLIGNLDVTCPSGMKPPYIKPPGKKRPGKPGQKKGHQGICRKSPEAIDEYVSHKMDSCPNCHGSLGSPVKNHKRVIMDIPEVKPKVTEHTVYGYWCPKCKKIVYPKVMDALPNATLGLTMLVTTAWMHYWVGISVRNIARILSVFFRFDVSPGGLTQAWTNLAMTLKPQYAAIGKLIRNSAYLHIDETGWRLSGKSFWLWCFATSKWCYYIIDKGRGSPVIKKVLGKIFDGILICDFYGAYNKMSALAKQRCFYHLFTELAKVDKSNKADNWKTFRKKLIRLLKDAVRLSLQKSDVPITTFEERKKLLLIRLDAIIASPRDDKDVNRIIKRLIRHRDEMFTFLDFENISPYNNHAEQQIRRPSISRKISQQNRSDRGALAHAIFMTLFRSAELQGLNPVDTIILEAEAAIKGDDGERLGLAA